MEHLSFIIFVGAVYSLYAADLHRGDESYDDDVGRTCLRFWRWLGVFK